MYGFEINRDLALPIAKQMEHQIRTAILDGKLVAGDRLLPTRSAARDLGIARNTVIRVYEQLSAEGYLVSREGSGIYVADIGRLPQPKLLPSVQRSKPVKDKEEIAFDAGTPDIGAFPRNQWAKLLKKACQEAEAASFAYGDFAGNAILRKAISSYIYRMKGILCNEDQVIIIPGTAGGMEILAKVFQQGKRRIAVEDPCIHFVKCIFKDHYYELCPVEVDGQGIMVERLQEYEDVDLIYTVPSHQFPMGGVLPATRRVALLQYANRQNAYIIEDDYDSEFRYKGEVIQAMYSLDRERVIYLGSFSKIFAPSLRIGYMILPGHLCEQVIRLMQQSNLWVGGVEQLALAEFLEQKLMDRHIYRMRKLYENKRKHLIRYLTDAFGSRMEITGESAGMHLLASFDHALTEPELQALEKLGVEIDSVEDYALVKGRNRNRIVLGYGGLTHAQMEEGVRRIKSAIDHES